jgi:hypothetical protein
VSHGHHLPIRTGPCQNGRLIGMLRVSNPDCMASVVSSGWCWSGRLSAAPAPNLPPDALSVVEPVHLRLPPVCYSAPVRATTDGQPFILLMRTQMSVTRTRLTQGFT